MGLISYTRGQSSVVLRVKILNSSVSTGAGLTGLTSASAGLIVSTLADNEAAPTTYTQAGSTIETIATLGTYAAPTATKCRFKEVDATNHKGVYEIQIADARFAVANAKSLIVSIAGATNAAETDVVIPLLDTNPYDGVRGGVTALPNAAAAAPGGLPTVGTGSGQLNPASGGVDVQTIKTQAVTCAGGVTVNGNVGTTQPVNFNGTSTSAMVKTDVEQINTQAVTAAGAVAVAANIGTATAALAVDASGRVDVGKILGTASAGAAGKVALDLAQAIPNSNTAQTVGDALNAARAQGFGKWTISGTTLTLYAGDGTTIVRSFTLDSATAPTQRV